MKRAASILVAFSLLAATALSPSFAGGPRAVNGLGQPMAWETMDPIEYHCDSGGLGVLSHATACALVGSAFGRWQSVAAGPTFSAGPPLPSPEINADGVPANVAHNWLNYWRNDADAWSPVIFDDDGAIIDELFGVGARFDVLGVAGLDTPIGVDTEIHGASIIVNGAFHDGDGLPDSPEDISIAALEAVIVHEIGHFLNLDHSVLNHDLAIDNDPANDIYVPTMYPFSVLDDAALLDPNPDDIAALKFIYQPTAGLTIGGSVRDGNKPFQGAHVVVRNTAAPLMDAYSTVSGGTHFPCNPGSPCDPCQTTCSTPSEQGEYLLDHLAPGDYTVCIEQFDRRIAWSHGTFVGPLPTPALVPGPEECFNTGANPESALATDDPDDSTTVVAGMAVNIDIRINAFAGTDPFEPNDTLGTAYDMLNFANGRDTEGAVLGPADIDYFIVPVTAGQRLRVDIDADEFGAGWDPVIGLFDDTDTLVLAVDDGLDPDTSSVTLDPSIDMLVHFTGNAVIGVSSWPDLDVDGAGGVSDGPYWLRVEVESLACPPGTDPDTDTVCDPFDNCPGDPNTNQLDTDGDRIGDVCDVGPDVTRPEVDLWLPFAGQRDVALATDVVVTMNEEVDVATLDSISVYLSDGSGKTPAVPRLSSDRKTLSLDPVAALVPDTGYSVHLTADLRDLAGNPAVPFTFGFHTIPDLSSGTSTADQYGSEAPGTTVCGESTGDEYGSSVAVAGDVNADGTADLVVGAPGVVAAALDNAGRASLVFGGEHLQSFTGPAPALHYETKDGDDRVGASVARIGNFNSDDYPDLLFGAPLEDSSGADAGAAYVVFGDSSLMPTASPLDLDLLGDCSSAAFCGVRILGEAAGDRAGASVSFAGDVNGDGHDDILIGAPLADPSAGRDNAGKVYLIYGGTQWAGGGTIELIDVGEPGGVPGLVFHGETAGDRAGEAVSEWPRDLGSPAATDDLIIGAPGASPEDAFGADIPSGGQVYAILGGATLVPSGGRDVIELSRVANAAMDQVAGWVFLGAGPGGEIGRSVTGAIDLDLDGKPDVAFGGLNQAWSIPGDGPKQVSGSSRTGGMGGTVPVAPMIRNLDGLDSLRDMDAVLYLPESIDAGQELVVGAAGDPNDDGSNDLLIGVPEADPPDRGDGGVAYLVYGNPAPYRGEIELGDVGVSVAGLRIEGAEPGDLLGTAVGGGPDVNGDGIDDALVGAPLADQPTSPTDTGEAYVISPVAADPILTLSFEKLPGTLLEWARADRSLSYNVYRGLISQLLVSGMVRTSQMAQLACGINGDSDSDSLPDVFDGDVPTAGDVYYYLVTGGNLFGESTLAPPRLNDAPCPP